MIDCNRIPDHPDSIPPVSASIPIPGNAAVTESEAQCRRRVVFDPYHQAIAKVLSRRDRVATQLLSIHSFTPRLEEKVQPWSIGVCYLDSSDWARKILSALKARTNESIGENEPYTVESDYDYTIPVQGENRGIPSVMIEVRQDKLTSAHAVQHWSSIIAESCLP